jgi:hypothetical protein
MNRPVLPRLAEAERTKLPTACERAGSLCVMGMVLTCIESSLAIHHGPAVHRGERVDSGESLDVRLLS